MRVDRIKLEARQAATKYSDINAACPYPFGSPAAYVFTAEFEKARAEMEQAEDDDEPGIFCACDLQPTLDEMNWNRCTACGKAYA